VLFRAPAGVLTFVARERGIELPRGLLGIGGRVSQNLEGATTQTTTTEDGNPLDVRHIL